MSASRPGGRTERVRRSALEAALEELIDKGFTGVTMENVALRASVHKTTLYRRWGTVQALIVEALEPTLARWAVPDTGSLRGDLEAIALELVRTFADPELRAIPEAVVVGAMRSADTVEALRTFYADRLGRAAVVVRRAVERGELPAGTDPVEVLRATCAPVFLRVFITREPVDEAVAHRAVDAALAAAAAGVFAG
ncbi:TetR/AcrR family transcriptional regulator [Umezawaea beigongshangensis]|uniref:TetR/AcrR family transcriptional regulator n=1 Tax=Umezawaea beigongshangensis TaxID=2780383 RepID=UPI0018F1B817|nr:TetR/AcrR family transcriptional regulator [Umezawaea beigongshangensis]